MNMKSIVLVCAVVVSTLSVCQSTCPIYEGGLSGGDKTTVVNKHNELRGLISQGKVAGQPKGTNLKQMKYDETLARSAQQLANSCQFAHSKVTDGRWHAVGQNLYMTMSTGFGKGADWANAIQTWFDEHVHYRNGGPINKQNGHYTQVVWADTEYVGCGYVNFDSKEFLKYRKLYVCNYGPAGNYRGQLPYKT